MSHLDIKICGLKTAEAVDAALQGGASHIGFIFFAKSPRNIAPAEAERLRQAAQGRAKAVAVTVNADDAALDAIVGAMQPDILQLHGQETPARLAEVKTRYGLPVWKALAVHDRADILGATVYEEAADRLLFDAKPPKDADLPGGNGVAFDWSLLAALDPSFDFMLSGGLNAGNVAEALAATKPGGLDISSGVEHAPGEKDPQLITAFFAAVRAAQERLDRTGDWR